MHFRSITPDSSVSLFVRDILVFEESHEGMKTVLPFFADGYPGLLFHESKNGMRVSPHDKQMPPLFLYGQTLRPVELHLEGSFRTIVVQLYPFVVKHFFGVLPTEINDDCHDLGATCADTVCKLQQTGDTNGRVELLRLLLTSAFQAKRHALDLQVRQAILLILENKGLVSISAVAETLCLTLRTLERRFKAETGIPPKQFAQIIQFQLSLEQLTVNDFAKLSDVVYANGFADQSHFTRVFKAYTGKTPKKFQPAHQ
jgi:AraC-like DNA-binding protein